MSHRQLNNVAGLMIIGAVLIAATTFTATAQSTPRQATVVDTGMVRLAPTEVIRFTVVRGFTAPNTVWQWRQGVEVFSANGCTTTDCKYTRTSRLLSQWMSLSPGEAVFFELQPLGDAMRVALITDQSDTKTTCEIVDLTTNASRTPPGLCTNEILKSLQ